VRLAGAIAQVAWRILALGQHVSDAIRAPRIHADGSTVHLEGGWGEEAARGLGGSWDVVPWGALNLFFGGVQAVQVSDARFEAAGDPRRGGAGVVVR
jgi:gamma-glutamyltranspeptidase